MNGDVESGSPAESGYSTDITSQYRSDSDLNTLDHKVVVFSKSTCPYSHELKRSLASHGVPYAVIEVDKHTSKKELIPALKSKHQFNSFPVLFVDGIFYGGIDEFKKHEHDRNLVFLAPHMTAAKLTRETKRVNSISPFAWYPDSYNSRAVRASAVFVFIYAGVCIAFWNRSVTRWAVLALAIDYAVRSLFGPGVSGLGVVGTLVVSPFQPDYRPSGPKQVNDFIGLGLATFAAGVWLGGYKLGVIILGVLMGVAFFESLDLCLGSSIYGLLGYLGVIPSLEYRAAINLKQDKVFWWNFVHRNPAVYQKAVRSHVLLEGQTYSTEVDLVRKERYETEYKNKDVGVIRFTKIDYFAMPMAIGTLAWAYNLLTGETLLKPDGQVVANWGPGVKGVSDALGISAACIFVAMGIVYLLRIALYPRKVWKELNHPTYGNYFSAVSICLSLFAILIFTRDRYYGIAMTWGAAVLQMSLSVFITSRFAFVHTSEESINASTLLTPIGNFFVAIAFAQYPADALTGTPRISEFGVNYTYIARLWASVAMLFSIVLFTITLRKSFIDTHSDSRARHNLWTWQAAASIAGPAFYAVSGQGWAVGTSFGYQFFWLIALFFFAVNCVGWLKGFYTFSEDMSIWVMAFACSALTVSTIHYHSFVSVDKTTEVFVYFALAISSATTAVCFLYTVIWTLDFSIFKPRAKWGPLSFVKLTHEAFRFVLPQLKETVKQLDISKPHNIINAFIEQIDPFLVAYKAHAAQEDLVIFPAVNAVFPNLTGVTSGAATENVRKEHADEAAVIKEIETAIVNIKKGHAVQSAITTIQKSFPAFADHVLSHLRNEEQLISTALSKYTTLDRQKELTRLAYESTSSDDWHIVLPYIVSRLPSSVWKVQFVSSLVWALPERAQELGLILYRGLDSVQFAFVASEIPDIVPRGAYGYYKKY